MDTIRLMKESGIVDFLDTWSTYCIVGHKEPDGDCIGSQLALASFLSRRGKRVLLLSSGPFARTEIARYARFFSDKLDPLDIIMGQTALVVLDCSSIPRIGAIADSIPAGLPVAFIDHHAAGDARGDVRFVDTKAPAVTCLIQAIIESDGAPTKEEAEYLLFGLCTDTGFFRHLDERSADVFSMASRLVLAGASPKSAFELMNGGKPFASRKFMGELLNKAEAHYDGKLIITSASLEDQERYGLVGRDSDMLYQLLMTVEGMEVAVVVRQESPDDCTVGFRSRDTIDVSTIAAAFGGGGHRLASGLHIAGQVDDIVAKMIAAFAPVFSTGLPL